MNLKDVKHKNKEEMISIRLYEEDKQWLIENNINATQLFEKAMQKLKTKM